MLNSLFFKACEHNMPKVVQKCIDNGANVHVWYDYVLRWASRNGHVEVANLLREHMEKK